jgi:ABC-2 type transport system ATP-binding protein
MIEVEGLTRSYGRFLAVDDVSFAIDRGEIVGLLGHNGAGKTTIMKMITGYLEPTRGCIEIDGMDLASSRQDVQRRIGYLPEVCPVYPDMTVIDYLDYAASLHGIAESKRLEKIRDAIDKTELASKATARISTLSRGFTQRVGVAQAILHEPGILILDEPTNGLDPTQIHHMRDLVRSLAKEATVILSTHILQEVQAVCDRAIIIRRGKKVLDERIDALREGRRLLLAIDAPPDRARALLAGLSTVDGIEELGANGPRYEYAITLARDAEPEPTAAEVARRTVEGGQALYALAVERHDLETIFGTIAAGEGATHDA